MTRALLATVLAVAFAVTALGLRTAVHLRRYGDRGWRVSHSSWSGPAARAHGLLVMAGILLFTAPIAALATSGQPARPGGVESLASEDTTAATVSLAAGLLLAALGTGITVVAQLQMGRSWRIGLDPTERTALVTGGLFSVVRNPIYSGMGMFALGQALLVPNLLALAALVSGLAGLEVQVRSVEEPHLLHTHGEAYRRWASTAGRFVPGLGGLRS
jgi:protein-S-isoprenylcysteine O-methyltransferase Ste14